jgi:hypothetical protein
LPLVGSCAAKKAAAARPVANNLIRPPLCVGCLDPDSRLRRNP